MTTNTNTPETEHELGPQWWGSRMCAEKLQESDKSDEIEDLLWDLKGTVFYELKKLGKFDDDAEGPDNEQFINAVIVRLLGAY